jgi:aminoglycoside 6-adenylyltransferase
MEPEEPIAIQRVARWAGARDDIRAAILIGSRARTDHPADEFSDIDVLLLVRDPEALLDDGKWPGELGEVAITFVEETPVPGIRERRALYQDGTDIDFAIIPVERVVEVGETGSDTLARGYRVLVDKDGLTDTFAAAKRRTPAGPPGAHEFAEAVSDFWYHTVWTSRKLARGEVFTAKGCLDEYTKTLVVRMLKWHAGGHDTWHEGRFLEEWSDPRVLVELRDAYARYDADDVERALIATMDLVSWLARETAGRLGYAYAANEEQVARRLTQQVLRSASWR